MNLYGAEEFAHPGDCPACSNFIQQGSKEANALHREAPTTVGADPVDSSLLDRVLMAGALEHLQARIRQAQQFLTFGLIAQRLGAHHTAQAQFESALKALGSLGAS